MLLTMFVGGVLDRSAVAGAAGQWLTGQAVLSGTRPRIVLASVLGRRWKLWLITLAAAEIAASWLVITSLIRISRHSTGLSAGAMRMASAGSRSAGATAVLVLIALLLTLILTSVLLRASLWQHALGPARSPWWLSPRACVYASLLAYAIAVIAPVRDAAQHSHLILMAQTMLLIAASPALLMSAMARRAPACARTRHGLLAPFAAVVFVIVLYLWHLPFAHDAAMTNPGLEFLRIASSIAAGLLVWAVILSVQRREASSRLLALLIVSIPSGLLGIGLVIAPQPLFQMIGEPALGLTSLTDQRLAGALMMAVDVLILLPVLSYLMAQTSTGRERLALHLAVSR